mmetsp:Transcript_22322/g.32955  ORF Transcript_22322/g.32955 Transcript_22322/m.32955 type:complete len:95 (-) Transcript_22322:309-593(-)
MPTPVKLEIKPGKNILSFSPDQTAYLATGEHPLHIQIYRPRIRLAIRLWRLECVRAEDLPNHLEVSLQQYFQVHTAAVQHKSLKLDMLASFLLD